MNTLIKEENRIENEASLNNFFELGCNNKQTLGVEFEKIPIRNSDFKAPDFFFKNGILDFLYKINNNSKCISSCENDILLGLITNSGNITLEPGCQVEMSFKPAENISDIESELKKYNKFTSQIADSLGISFLALGIQPVSTYQNIKIIPKNRYEHMTKFFKDKGSLAYVMMRETAGIQTSIDYSNEEDAIQKLSCALKITTILSSFFVNSPIRNGKLSNYKSFRLNAWLNTDNKRCGLISKKLIETPFDFSFSDYTQILLDIPTVFHKKNYTGAKTFRNLIAEKIADFADWETHASLFFPDARIKQYIEIRNHDCQKEKIALAIPSIYKGIFYSANEMQNVNELLKNFSYYDYEFIRQNAPRFGMDFEINNRKISSLVKELFLIAKDGLTEIGLGEEKYLDDAFELLNDNLTPADVIIKNFEGSWHKNIKKLVEYSKI